MLELCNIYVFNMNIFLGKSQLNFLNNPLQRNHRKSLLHYIGCGWYVNKLGQKEPPLKKSILSKKSQKEEDEINRKLTKANQCFIYWKFQIHWNKLEWVN